MITARPSRILSHSQTRVTRLRNSLPNTYTDGELKFRAGLLCSPRHTLYADVTLMILSMFTVAKAILEVLTVLQECEGNGFPLHTYFLRDHTPFARLLTFTKSDLIRL